jgi:cytochrome c2
MLLLCAACGGATAGDAARGSALFNGETSLTGALKCAGCHAVDPAKSGGIGPNLSNIGNRAATTIQGMDAREYLRQSIVAPDAYLARGYQEGIHPRDYGKALTQQQIDDLIAYMLTLKSDRDSR